MTDNRMTTKEKARLVTGSGKWHTWDNNGKIPSLLLTDGPHGLRKQAEGEMHNNVSVTATCFPTACALASSWDPELAGEMGAAIGNEAVLEEVSVVLGPGVNMKRSPACGRNFEYYSEDPLLAGRLATGFINGIQSRGVGCSLKHFACNNQETKRMTSNSVVDDRALREIYLAAFETAVKESQPATIMSSYNRVNGKYVCASKELLTDILRKEWGFRGLVVSDWGACVSLPECIEAGMDLEMPDSCGNHLNDLLEGLQNGSCSEASLDRAVSKITELIKNYSCKSNSNDASSCNIADEKAALLKTNHAIARHIASESAVLLKNNGLLPLKKGSKVLIVGHMAEHMRIQGGGSSHINTSSVTSALDALRAAGIDAAYVKGYNDDSNEPDVKLASEALRAAKAAAGADTPILFFGGLTDSSEGEAYDRTSFDIPACQQKLLSELTRISDKVAFVAFGGSPFSLDAAKNAAAILMMYLGGEAVGEACADLITGAKNPCGKLAETWPKALSDTPCAMTFGMPTNNVPYRESIFIGYRYYDTFKVPVAYPFGFGMSYTDFEYSDMKITVSGLKTAAGLQKDTVQAESPTDSSVSESGTAAGLLKGAAQAESLTDSSVSESEPAAGLLKGAAQAESLTDSSPFEIVVSLNVKNAGMRDGFETVQIYVKNPVSNIMRPEKELRGFKKVYIPAGVTTTVEIVLTERSFSVFDTRTGSFAVPTGDYEILAASGIDNVILSAPIHIDGVTIERNERILYPSYFADSEEHFTEEDFNKLYGKEIQNFDIAEKGSFSMCSSLRMMAKESLFARAVLKSVEKRIYGLYPDKSKNDPEVKLMLESCCDGTIDLTVNQSDGKFPRKTADATVLAANGHTLKALASLLRAEK